MSLGRHTRPTCIQGFTRSLKLCQICRFNSCVRVFFIPRGSRGLKPRFVTSISHMGQMRDSDWSRRNLLRCDWLPTRVATLTTYIFFPPSLTPHPKSQHFSKVPLSKVGLTVVSKSIFAVYEMTQPLKFFNSVGLLCSLTSTIYH